MLGFSFSCLTAWGSELIWTVVCGRCGCKGKEGKGRERKRERERKGKEGKGRERKGKEGNGCGRRGCKGVAGNGWGEEAAGDERAWLRGRLRTSQVNPTQTSNDDWLYHLYRRSRIIKNQGQTSQFPTAAPPRPLKIGNRALSFQACVFCKFNQYVFVGSKTPFYLQMDGWIDR